MTASGFVHLHCHSTWSLLDGTIRAEDLPRAAAAAGYDAVALTDHDALTGAVRFSKACKAAGVKPLYGAELTMVGGSHVTVLARDATGYGNLCRLITEAHLHNERGHPATARHTLIERSEGLFVLSGCARGEVAQLAAAGRLPQAVATARRWRAALGEGYRIEVFDFRDYGHRALRDRLLEVARAAGVPAVATNDVHYTAPAGAAAHEVLHAIKDIVPLSAARSLRATSEYYLKPLPDMAELFEDCPEVLAASSSIARECDYDLDLGGRHLPAMPWIHDLGESATGCLARRCWSGATRRFGRVTKEIEDRLQHELRLINKLGFASYFLLVAEIVEHVRYKLEVRCACRGSAAASLVCYALGISDVDPVRYDLLFERFLNERREGLPDIDLDVESHRREEVLAYILDTYGPEQTAVCCMVDTFRARMAIREVGKALGLPAGEIDLVAKAFPRIAARAIPQAIERLPELAGSNLAAGSLEQLFELCLAVDGWPRHLALHPSGVILSSPDLKDRVPVQESFGGFAMLQADKHDVEDLGLVKLDVLGVRMLSAMTHACDEIERVRETSVDLDSLPRDDDSTWRLIRSSRTLGCFQIESPGQRELLARLQPQRFEDLIVDISLFRPGPVKSDMVTPFLNRRHGFAEPVYPHESLMPILKETGGVIVYHEQVIRVIAAVTGCSLADADFVRRHLDSDRPVMQGDPSSRPARRELDGPDRGAGADNDMGAWFVTRAEGQGFAPDEAAALWREVLAFASFGFCKSHAAAFALPTYLSSWLKAHYPAELFAGLLTHDPGMYPRRLIVADARHFGVPILPVDVNRSAAAYHVEPVTCSSPCDGQTEAGYVYGVRLALGEVKDISQAEIDSIRSEQRAGRAEQRPGHAFTSLEDLWRRTELSQPVLANLVHLGALDSISGGRSRRELLWRAADLAPEKRALRSLRPAQLSLELDEPIGEALPGLAAYSHFEETEAELEVTGIDATRHVMVLYEGLAAELGCTLACDLGSRRNNSEVWVSGVKVASQTPAIRSGQRIIFVTLDDASGPIDVTVFERAQARCARTVFHSWLLAVRGIVRKRGGASLRHPTDPKAVGVTVVVSEVFDLAELAADRRGGHSLAAALGRQRRKQALGAASAPARADQPRVSGRPWHASGGSTGP